MLHFELATRYTAVETIGHVRAIAGTYIALSRSDRETDIGWLVLTHGMGAMRSYSIGAMPLDFDMPLLARERYGQDGYVPNVV